MIHCFVFNAPARAFIEGIKCHYGEYYAGKVFFPRTDAKLRTNDSFKCMVDEDHHVMSCPLNPLNAGFVSKFGLDYVHLICLGVMRRFLLYWKSPVGPMYVNLALPVCLPVQIKEHKFLMLPAVLKQQVTTSMSLISKSFRKTVKFVYGI